MLHRNKWKRKIPAIPAYRGKWPLKLRRSEINHDVKIYLQQQTWKAVESIKLDISGSRSISPPPTKKIFYVSCCMAYAFPKFRENLQKIFVSKPVQRETTADETKSET